VSQSQNKNNFTQLAFSATLEIIGVNPYVFVPLDILQEIFVQSGKDKGAIPICGTCNGKPYTQTLVRYSGDWRLYINTTMLPKSPERVGETLALTVAFDQISRAIEPHPKFVQALQSCPQAQRVFDALSPSRKHEIVRYIASLKTEAKVDENVIRAIDFLCGRGRFVGRDHP
jgi:hypothetical protein